MRLMAKAGDPLNLRVQDASRTAAAGIPPFFSRKSSDVREISFSPRTLFDAKRQLRRELRQARAALSPASRWQAERAVAAQARRAGWLKPGKRIAAYVPTGSEFSPWPLILLALRLGAQVYLPRVPRQGKLLEFVRLDAATRWEDGAFGIPEPLHAETCSPRRLDTVFLPLVGFDAAGFRLGQGGGYYDTTFSFRRTRRRWLKPRLIGLGFACQQVARLPVEPWDLRLDACLSA